MAVGDDGSAHIEALGSLSTQVLQRDVDRARDVLGLVLPRCEDLNELSALLHELLDGVTVYHRGHVYLLFRLQRVGVGWVPEDGELFSAALNPR